MFHQILRLGDKIIGRSQEKSCSLPSAAKDFQGYQARKTRYATEVKILRILSVVPYTKFHTWAQLANCADEPNSKKETTLQSGTVILFFTIQYNNLNISFWLHGKLFSAPE